MSVKTIAQVSIVALAVGAVSLPNLAEAQQKNWNSSKSNTSAVFRLPDGKSARADFSYVLKVRINREKPLSPAARAAIVREICAQAKKDLFRSR